MLRSRGDLRRFARVPESRIRWRSVGNVHITAPEVQTHIEGVGAEDWGEGRHKPPPSRFWGRCGMRHIIVASSMLVIALVVTFGAASILQGRAIAAGPSSNEPFVIIEAAKPAPVKTVATKERGTSQFRERSAHTTSAQVGL